MTTTGTWCPGPGSTSGAVLRDMIVNSKVITPPPQDSWQRIDSSLPSFRLPRLSLEDCPTTHRFDSKWEECVLCPRGFVKSPLQGTECIQDVTTDDTWVWVLVGCGALLIVVGIPLALYLKSNWKTIRRLSVMEVTVVVSRKVAGCLALYEVDEAEVVIETEGHRLPKQLKASFGQLLGNLRAYKPYLPHACFAREEDEEHDIRRQSQTPAPEEVQVTRQSVSSTSQSVGSSRTPSIASRGSFCVSQINIKAKIKRARVSLVSSNVVGYLTTFPDLCGSEHAEWMAGDVELWVTGVGQAKGVVDTVAGDRRSASFNGRKPCANHAIAAVGVAFNRPSPGAAMSAGVVTGPVVSGDFGGSSLVRYMVLGSLTSFLSQVERIARQWNCTVLASQEAYGAAEFQWDGVLKGAVTYKKWSNAANRLFSIVEYKGIKNQDNEEWMYQL
eukprot:Hpha_TRINITY_DN15036_c1_g10::TRINITY_DN15036_c1_g10_i1::g.123316::m.123316